MQHVRYNAIGVEQESSLGSMIASRWFWVSAAFFLVLYNGDWLKGNAGGAILAGGAIGLVNVLLSFGIALLLYSKTDLEPNFFLSALILFVSNLLTLIIVAPFIPNDFKSFGDYCLGAAVMVLLVGAAQSIPKVFKIGG